MELVLARNCRRLRKERGFRSREAFSEFADIPFPTYRSIESGLSWPEKPNIEKIAKAFGVPESTLFADHERVDPAKSAKLCLFEIVAALDESRARELLPEIESMNNGAKPNDPLAGRVSRLGPEARQYVEDLVQGLEDSPPSPDPGKGTPEKSK